MKINSKKRVVSVHKKVLPWMQRPKSMPFSRASAMKGGDTETKLVMYRDDHASLEEAQECGGTYTAYVMESSVEDAVHAAEVALYAAGLDDRIIITEEDKS